MSTNSAAQFSVEDDGSLSETPTQSKQKCTRGLPCSKTVCLVCSGPATNNHIRNLTHDLVGSNQLSRTNTPTKPTASTDHWITNLSDAFKEAILDHDIDKIKHLNSLHVKIANKSTNHFQYNCTELKKLFATSIQITAALYTPPPF